VVSAASKSPPWPTTARRGRGENPERLRPAHVSARSATRARFEQFARAETGMNSRRPILYAEASGHAKILPSRDKVGLMDIERINLIGTTLADLIHRTEALRGYL
jgi:hypothetical protein